MPIIGNPWAQDAGQYGAGLGQMLGQALIQQPQMRYQMALQQAEMAQRQQQAIAQQQYQQGQLGMSKSELDLHRQELTQNEQMHQLELERLKRQTELAEKGVWKLGETKTGVPYRINTITGETVPLDTVFAKGGDTNNPTTLGGLGVPPTQNQGYENFLKGTGQIGQWNATGMKTNAPAIYQMLTNAVSGLGARLAPQQQAAPLGLGQALAATPPQALGAVTNAIRQFNPATGRLE